MPETTTPQSIPAICDELRYAVEALAQSRALHHLHQLDASDSARRAHQLLANAGRGDWSSVKAFAARLLPDDISWAATWAAVHREVLTVCCAVADDPVPGVEVRGNGDLKANDFLRGRAPIGELREGETVEAPPYAPAAIENAVAAKTAPVQAKRRGKSKKAPPAVDAEMVPSAASRTTATEAAGKGRNGQLEEAANRNSPAHRVSDEAAHELHREGNALLRDIRDQLKTTRVVTPEAPRLCVENGCVHLDGELVPLDMTPDAKAQAMRYLGLLTYDRQSDPDVQRLCPDGALDGRLDRLRQRFPQTLLAVIDTNRKGSRLKRRPTVA